MLANDGFPCWDMKVSTKFLTEAGCVALTGWLTLAEASSG